MGFGTSISQELIDQLREENGLSRKADDAPCVAPPAVTQLARTVDPRALRAHLQSSKQAASALYASKEIGGLLLKQEDVELAKVRHRAAEVLQRDRSAGSGVPPCTEERTACLACYKAFPGDVLQCASAVQEYQQCARRCLQREATSKG